MDRQPAHEPVDSARAAHAGPLVRAAVQRLRLSPASGDQRIGRGDAHRPVLLRLCGHPGRVHGIVRDAVPWHGQRRTWRPAIAAHGDADAAQHRHDLRDLPRPGTARRRRASTSRTRARRQSQARAARHRREHGAAIGDSSPAAESRRNCARARTAIETSSKTAKTCWAPTISRAASCRATRLSRARLVTRSTTSCGCRYATC